MDIQPSKKFEHSPGAWVIIAAVLLLNVWYDYYHPLGVIVDVIIAIILLAVYLSRN